jgi:hypothetical protein
VLRLCSMILVLSVLPVSLSYISFRFRIGYCTLKLLSGYHSSWICLLNTVRDIKGNVFLFFSDSAIFFYNFCHNFGGYSLAWFEVLQIRLIAEYTRTPYRSS